MSTSAIIEIAGLMYCEEAQLMLWFSIEEKYIAGSGEEEHTTGLSKLGRVLMFPTLAKLPVVCDPCVRKTA